MLTRKIGFDVVYQVQGGFERERVAELKFSIGGSDYDQAKTVSGRGIQLHPLYAFLLQFTGEFDRDGKPIHHGDLLADDEGTIYEVMFYNGAYCLHAPGDEEGTVLENAICMTLRIVGDVIRNAAMTVPPNPEEIMKASIERKELPFIDLPLAG